MGKGLSIGAPLTYESVKWVTRVRPHPGISGRPGQQLGSTGQGIGPACRNPPFVFPIHHPEELPGSRIRTPPAQAWSHQTFSCLQAGVPQMAPEAWLQMGGNWVCLSTTASLEATRASTPPNLLEENKQSHLYLCVRHQNKCVRSRTSETSKNTGSSPLLERKKLRQRQAQAAVKTGIQTNPRTNLPIFLQFLKGPLHSPARRPLHWQLLQPPPLAEAKFILQVAFPPQENLLGVLHPGRVPITRSGSPAYCSSVSQSVNQHLRRDHHTPILENTARGRARPCGSTPTPMP